MANKESIADEAYGYALNIGGALAVIADRFDGYARHASRRSATTVPTTTCHGSEKDTRLPARGQPKFRTGWSGAPMNGMDSLATRCRKIRRSVRPLLPHIATIVEQVKDVGN